MLFIVGAALIALALFTVYAISRAVRQPGASRLVSRLAKGNVIALGATILIALGAGVLFQAAAQGGTPLALGLALAAFALPFVGLAALARVRPLPEPFGIEPLPGAVVGGRPRRGRTGQRLAAEASARIAAFGQTG